MKTKFKILLIDDDTRLTAAVDMYLTKAGYDVTVNYDGRSGLRTVYQNRPDLIVLDIMLPEMDGWEVCARIREITDVPVIMLTARGQESDKVRGLKMGADDYLIKPFSLHELEARIGAVLRRSRAASASSSNVLYADDELVIDAGTFDVTCRGELLTLTATERRLLFFLAENVGRILPTSRILEAVWGPEFVDNTNYVKLYIWRLRHKIESDPEQPKYILTERGIGYRFAR